MLLYTTHTPSLRSVHHPKDSSRACWSTTINFLRLGKADPKGASLRNLSTTTAYHIPHSTSRTVLNMPQNMLEWQALQVCQPGTAHRRLSTSVLRRQPHTPHCSFQAPGAAGYAHPESLAASPGRHPPLPVLACILTRPCIQPILCSFSYGQHALELLVRWLDRSIDR